MLSNDFLNCLNWIASVNYSELINKLNHNAQYVPNVYSELQLFILM